MEKAREFQKNIYFYFIDYAKAFDCVDHKKLENSLLLGGLSCYGQAFDWMRPTHNMEGNFFLPKVH